MGFKADINSDLSSVFFNTEEFAVSAVYNPAGGTSYAIKGIFDEAYEGVNPNGAEVMSTQPKIQTAVSFVRGVSGPGDTITIEGTTYKIREYQPDGVGLVDLLLTEVDNA
jgi:hypothetical protein